MAASNPSKPDPPSPSASYYDMSDSEEHGYSTISHSSVSRGVKLLYSKSKVYVHPTPSAKDNIPGFIALVQQKTPPSTTENRSNPTTQNDAPSKKKANAASYLLAWVPESSLNAEDMGVYVKVDLKEDSDSPPKQTYLVPPLPLATTFDSSPVGPYAFSFPLSEIYSIHVRPPSLGWWYGSVVVNTRSGASLPALFFHDSECESTILQKKKRARESFDPFGESGDLFWGGDEVLRWLKRYVTVERSTSEPSIYLIDPSEEDLVGFGQGRKSMEGQRSPGGTSRPAAPKNPPGPGMDPLTKVFKETRWKILEQLSKVTTMTRRAAEDLANNKNLPPQVRRLIQNPQVQTLSDEFDSAKLYLARWAMSIAEQSEREKKQRIWTAKDVLESEETSVGDFEILSMEAGQITLSDSKRRPVDLDEWRSFFDSKGKLHVTVEEVKERVFHGGLDAEDGVRKEAWPFLLGVYEWDSTEAERHAYMNSKRDEYIQLKGAWWDRVIDGQATPEQEEWWKEQKGRIEKDVHRTDRHIPLFAGEDIPHPDPTSPFYNPNAPGTNVHMEQLKDMLLTYLEYDTPPPTSSTSSSTSSPRYTTRNPNPQNLGYVQGMSDLLSPLYAVFQDDAVAFWAFVAFMRRMSRNFVRSQAGMRAQLNTLDQLVQIMDPKLYVHLEKADSTNFFFFFRMLLVWFKREFDWSDVLRLWESLWTDFYSSQFHLFIALAILEKHRDVIIDHLHHFDEVLKYINELSGTIELQEILFRAEGLFRRFEKTVETVDRKESFPAPSGGLRQRNDSTADKDKGKSPQREQQQQATGSSTGVASRPRSRGAPGTPGKDTEPKEKVISPELRLLLSKKVVMLEGEDSAATRQSGLRD